MRVPGEAERSEAPVVEDPRHVAAPAHPIGGLEAPGGKAARTAAVRAYPVLLLQASAGNAAVSAMLARQEPAVAEPPAEAPDAGAGNRPMLRQGSRGSAVVDAQERLNTANPPAEEGLALDVPGLLRGVHA